MNRIFTLATVAFSFLCIAPGALIVPAAMSSTASAGDASLQFQLARDWTQFPPADRAICLTSTGSYGTYTDLIKCLEMKRDVRKLNKEPDIRGMVEQAGPHS